MCDFVSLRPSLSYLNFIRSERLCSIWDTHVGLTDTMQELWNTCALLEVRWDNPVHLKCQYLTVFGIFCHAVGWEEWDSSHVSVPIAPRIGRISLQKHPHLSPMRKQLCCQPCLPWKHIPFWGIQPNPNTGLQTQLSKWGRISPPLPVEWYLGSFTCFRGKTSCKAQRAGSQCWNNLADVAWGKWGCFHRSCVAGRSVAAVTSTSTAMMYK